MRRGRRGLVRLLALLLSLSFLGHDGGALILPETQCAAAGDYFDPTAQQCVACTELDPRAVPLGGGAGATGVVLQCVCDVGFVQCASGKECFARSAERADLEETFVATNTLECRECPVDADGRSMAVTRDRSRCRPCYVGPAGDESSTLGYSDEASDCHCPAGFALVERGEDGAYLEAKRCVRCAEGLYPGPQGVPAAVYECGPCPDERRMARNPKTGLCECRGSSDADGGNSQAADVSVFAGGVCVDVEDFRQVTDRYPLASAIQVKFYDAIDGREDLWEYGPFGSQLGIEEGGDATMEVLSMEVAGAHVVTASSSTMKWLYARCGVGCLRKNQTACECISNLCVLALYNEDATVCRFLKNILYEGRPPAPNGNPDGMPWLFYTTRPELNLADPSLTWKFTLGGAESLEAGTANSLVFWLARYSLEGTWLGWAEVGSELELCTTLGGFSSTPRSSTMSWRRFGSSLITSCRLLLSSLLRCGADPIFYDIFVQNVDRSLVPVPVRILNMVKDGTRPNRNINEGDSDDDALVRRFTLCDAVSGKEGEGSYLRHTVPTCFRWAAHMAIEVRSNPDAEAQIYVPTLSIAYAEKTTALMGESESVPVSFKAEYSMGVASYWVVVTVLFVITCVGILGLAIFRMYLTDKRFPLVVSAALPGHDPGLFAHKFVVLGQAIFSTVFTFFFWFHFVMALYWLFFFKLQDSPHLLLPSTLQGNQYEPCDVFLVIEITCGAICVGLGLYKQLKIFIFLVDWERGAPGHAGQRLLRPALPPTNTQSSQGQPLLGGGGRSTSMHDGGTGAQLLGASTFDSHGRQQQAPLATQAGGLPHTGILGLLGETASPDAGVSAWRSIFICNELNERLSATRTVPQVTWLTMAFLLQGLGWKNMARWHPAVSGDEGALSAQFNPVLEYAFGSGVWMLIVAAQLFVQRIASIKLGHDLKDFVDLCSVSNISVFFMDEPFHGYYIHGKAPRCRGDLCHTELADALHDEAKGVGFHRGIVEGGSQAFEFYLPQELDVPMPGGGVANFRQSLHAYFTGVKDLDVTIRSRVPPQPTDSDVAERSRLRCGVQALFDAMVHAVMVSKEKVVQGRSARDKFLDLPPEGGVPALALPVFYEDTEELAWSSCLAYGAGLRPYGVEVPTGFEWHLILLELLVFLLIWRFHGSIYLAVSTAFLLDRAIIYLYKAVARRMLAYTTIIDPKFLI